MPYTRQEYIDRVPAPKITKFTMGNTEREFDYTLELLNLEDAQIRHNALEAARIAANRLLELKLDRRNYRLKIIPYPHQILRRHKMLAIPQADRFQEGMKKAYGKPVGLAARVERGDPLIVVDVPKKGIKVAKEALRRAKHKLPVPCRTLVKKNH